MIFDIDALATDDFVRFVTPDLDALMLNDELRMPRERVMIAMIPTEAVMGLVMCIEQNVELIELLVLGTAKTSVS